MNLTPHAVYTAYDAEGAPLYVGCTKNPAQRMEAHRASSAWHPQAAKITYTWLPTKATGRSFEAHRIRALSPAHNHAHNRPEMVQIGIVYDSWLKNALRERANDAGVSLSRYCADILTEAAA